MSIVFLEFLVTCRFLLFLEALNGAFEMQFFFSSGLNFYTLSKTLMACRDMQLRFFKVKTMPLNVNAPSHKIMRSFQPAMHRYLSKFFYDSRRATDMM